MHDHTDHAAIEQLLVHYCHLLDSREFHRLAPEVFSEDAVDDHGLGAWRGRSQIGGEFVRLMARFSGTAHVLGNVHIDLDGDAASSRSYVTAWHWLAETPPGRAADFVVVGAYHDELVRAAEGWRIARRRFRALGPSVLAAGEMPPFLQPRRSREVRP